MSVRHKTYGLIDTAGVTLDVKATVTSWSPKTGSIYGGTLLTIQGTNFGKVKTDNPVNIVSATGKSNSCFVIETAATQIKCRVDTLNMNKANNDAATMVVILRVSEEAKCDSPACAWTYTDSLPTVTSMTPSFDAAADIYKITVAGTGFTGAKEAVSMEINSWPQGATGALSKTSTEIVFGITNITSGVENKKMFMYFAEGVPKGHDKIQAGFVLEPKLT